MSFALCKTGWAICNQGGLPQPNPMPQLRVSNRSGWNSHGFGCGTWVALLFHNRTSVIDPRLVDFMICSLLRFFVNYLHPALKPSLCAAVNGFGCGEIVRRGNKTGDS